MKTLVTGGTGFTGTHLVQRLSREGHEVVVLSRNKEAKKGLPEKGVSLWVGDLREKDSLRGLPADLDYVFHCAAERDSAGERLCHATNVEGTRNLLSVILEQKVKLKKFIYVSSLGAAGFGKDRTPKTEEDPPEPVSFYGRTKLEAEQEVIRHREELPYIILRPCKIYGPGDKRILLHFKFVKYGLVPDLGLTKRFMSLCYIDDFVEAALLAAKGDRVHEIYFVSDGNLYSWQTFYETIARALDKKLRTIWVPEALMAAVTPLLRLVARSPQRLIPIEPTTLNEIKSRCWSCDPSKFFGHFGFRPRVDIETGLKKTGEWFRKNHFI